MSKSTACTYWFGFFCLMGWSCLGSVSGTGGTQFDSPSDAKETSDDSTEVHSSKMSVRGAGQEKKEIVQVRSFGRIDIAIEDQDITKVLQMLAIQSQLNILSSSDVSGNVSAVLYDVDFYEALDAILHTNGFGYIEEGNFIKVYTLEEITEIQEHDKKMVAEVVRLNHLTAEDAAKFIEVLLTPDKGSITVSAKDQAGFEPTLSSGGEKAWALVDTLLIHDYPEVIEEMLEVLRELDVKPRQVQIESTILEARLNEDNAFGVDLTVLADFALGEFTNPLSAITDLATAAVGNNGQAIQTTVGNATGGKSSMRGGILTHNFAAFIRALDEVTDTTVIANPTLLVLNRMPQKLISGEKLGYISTVQTETSSTQTVEFLEVGTQMTVRAFISGDDFVRMELVLGISEGEVRNAEGFVIPDETTNELISNVIIPSGRTYVLGGLFKEDTTISRSQVPGVAGLPIIGSAFRGQDDTVARSEVIFLIRPTVMRDENLVKIGHDAGHDVERVRAGTREGLLPWSRTLLTASHIRDARGYLAEGKTDKALWSINMALTLDPTAVEALRMREELNRKNMYWPDSGILQKVFESVVDQVIADKAAQAPGGHEQIDKAAAVAAQ